jgi:predicted ribosomally synthesized peptide with SipW-like signal peptide
MKQEIDLSRRHVLLGTGAVGLASIGAGLGTSALFSDTETFQGNQLTAGTLDLVVEYYTASKRGSLTASDQGVVNGDQEATYSYTVTDVKPGDTGVLAFCPRVVTNDGWIWVGSETGLVDYENGQTEPEAEVDATDGGSLDTPMSGAGAGELGDAIEVTVSYASGVTMDGDDVNCQDTRELNNPEGYTLADLAAELTSGFLLDGDQDEASPDADPSPYPGSADAATQEGPCLCIEWELPLEVGNEVQSDSISFDFSFVAEQARNNPDPANPFSQISLTFDGTNAAAGNFGTTTTTAQQGSGAWQSVGSGKETLYVYFNPGGETVPPFTVGDIDEISYYTNKGYNHDSGTAPNPPGGTPVDFYLAVYTEPTGGPGDDAGWYNKRLNAEPYYLNLAGDAIDAPANQWNEWNTNGTTTIDPLRFVDANRTGIGLGYADGTMPTLSDIQSGPVDWSALRSGAASTSIDYAAQSVKGISIQTGSGRNSSFSGLLDSVGVRLTDGTELVVDLEP